MDPNQLAALIEQHAWVAIAAIIIGGVVRLLKSDTPIPINVKPQYRAWLALGLGVVVGVLDALVAHKRGLPRSRKAS